MKEVILQLCGRTLGTAGDPEKFGTCDRELNHGTTRGGWRGCSSKALRAYQREATKASRERKKQAEAKEKAKEAAVAAGEIDASILDEDEEDYEVCACGHKYEECPNPKTCGLTKAQIEERQRAEAEAVAREEERVRRLAEQAEQRRFITECLDKLAVGVAFDEKKLTEVIASYLGFSGDKRFGLDPLERSKRDFNRDGINERRLSEALYGEEYNGFHAPPELDEHSFSVRLGRFLGVTDMRGCTRFIVNTKPPTVPTISVTPGVP